MFYILLVNFNIYLMILITLPAFVPALLALPARAIWVVYAAFDPLELEPTNGPHNHSMSY